MKKAVILGLLALMFSVCEAGGNERKSKIENLRACSAIGIYETESFTYYYKETFHCINENLVFQIDEMNRERVMTTLPLKCECVGDKLIIKDGVENVGGEK